jgi:hypothetical protein
MTSIYLHSAECSRMVVSEIIHVYIQSEPVSDMDTQSALKSHWGFVQITVSIESRLIGLNQRGFENVNEIVSLIDHATRDMTLGEIGFVCCTRQVVAGAYQRHCGSPGFRFHHPFHRV